ncbi:MAG: hypothetical protein ACYTEQ_01880 [Planctomycetota bacterium]|jgi:hypothetical protein
MRKSQFLLLDAGPIIKLFELGIWDKFIKRYDVTIARTVVEQSIYKGEAESPDFIEYPFDRGAERGLLKIIDVCPSKVKEFMDKYDIASRYAFDEGEDETLAYWFFQGKEHQVCSSDGAVFSVLGYLGRGEQGVSLEEVLKTIGISRQLEWRYTERFRHKYTKIGQIDAVQGQGLV